MADANQGPLLRVHGFQTKYERLPVKGGPLDDNLDEKGFRLDDKGRRVMEVAEVDWVHYSPAHSPLNTGTWERVKHLEVTDEMLRGEETQKINLMKLKWDQIKPAHEAWKSGNELPVDGTALGAWAGATAEKAEVLRRFSVRTVEEVARLSESQMEKIPLPGMREMRKQAAIFIEHRGAADSAAREADQDAEIARLRAELAETNAKFSAAMDMLAEKPNQGPATATVDSLRAELDAMNVRYHPNAGLEVLKARLAEANQGKAA